MPIKKKTLAADEELIFDDALIYKRGDYWQMRMWLTKEQKYARFSLKTRNKDTAIDKAKKQYHDLMSQQQAGKTYFSKTTKQGVEAYLQQRQLDVDAGLIKAGRFSTIRTHLQHWLDFIGRDTKLKELERTDCENYLHSRTKTKQSLPVSQVTVANEQSTINACMTWLHKRNDTYIDKFDFKPLKRIDNGDERNRRGSFTDDEIKDIAIELNKIIANATNNIDESDNLSKIIACHYLLIAIITGLRKGEQLQLRWQDIDFIEHNTGDQEDTYSLVMIKVRGETSKTGKTRQYIVKDSGEDFDRLFQLLYRRYRKQNKNNSKAADFATTLMFSADGQTLIDNRAIYDHFRKALEQADIRNADKRRLVPYSFRHYFITKRVNSNLPVAAVAEMCGTSITQIEKTYYHTTYEKMISNAMADYYYNKDGVLTPR